jgi:hypothetical protein
MALHCRCRRRGWRATVAEEGARGAVGATPDAGVNGISARVYQCAGLRVRSPLPLSAPIVSGPADVEVIEGAVRPVPYERPSAEVLAERVVDGVAWYTFARCGETVIGRLYRLADFVIDGGSRKVVFHRDPACDPEVVAILLAGTVTAYLLSAGGGLVLHASAVEVDGRALAFVGFSGQGKTTVATLLSTNGLPLVTDDLLPVNSHDGEVTCVPGGIELRVREKSQEVADWLSSDVPRRRTVDERLAVAVPVTDAERLALATVVIPWPDRQSTEVIARVLSPGEAAMSLARYQRVEGWTSPNVLRAQFDAITAVVATVPVLEMRIPWGPPFRRHLATEIAAASLVHNPRASTPVARNNTGKRAVGERHS